MSQHPVGGGCGGGGDGVSQRQMLTRELPTRAVAAGVVPAAWSQPIGCGLSPGFVKTVALTLEAV